MTFGSNKFLCLHAAALSLQAVDAQMLLARSFERKTGCSRATRKCIERKMLVAKSLRLYWLSCPSVRPSVSSFSVSLSVSQLELRQVRGCLLPLPLRRRPVNERRPVSGRARAKRDSDQRRPENQETNTTCSMSLSHTATVRLTSRFGRRRRRC